ncbi:MAG TPA: hypothetical protein VK191_01625 [Symbiobacteriaceae bacterium]|nr:hypothetical protein [Symbiobacteriaceae bacterium]
MYLALSFLAGGLLVVRGKRLGCSGHKSQFYTLAGVLLPIISGLIGISLLLSCSPTGCQ